MGFNSIFKGFREVFSAAHTFKGCGFHLDEFFEIFELQNSA
jgi:hypothetical protein